MLKNMSLKEIVLSDPEFFENRRKAFLYKYIMESRTLARILNHYSHNMKWYSFCFLGLKFSVKLAKSYIQEIHIYSGTTEIFYL